MNRSPASLRTALALATVLLLGTAAWAQKDKSLTTDFPNLSAKERSKIAARESEESQRDTSYQRLMQEAESTFQAGRFEEALALFEKARVMRPYNVYPKVKIEDLRAMIKRRDEAAAAAARDSAAAAVAPTPAPPAPVIDQPPAQVPPPKPELRSAPQEAPPPATPTLKPEMPPAAPAPTRTEQPAPVEPRQTPSSEPRPTRIIAPVPKNPPPPPDGMSERSYKEGQAIVIERTVVEDGHTIVYKRVFHNSGRVYYFQDGASIAERVWKERFNEPLLER